MKMAVLGSYQIGGSSSSSNSFFPTLQPKKEPTGKEQEDAAGLQQDAQASIIIKTRNIIERTAHSWQAEGYREDGGDIRCGSIFTERTGYDGNRTNSTEKNFFFRERTNSHMTKTDKYKLQEAAITTDSTHSRKKDGLGTNSGFHARRRVLSTKKNVGGRRKGGLLGLILLVLMLLVVEKAGFLWRRSGATGRPEERQSSLKLVPKLQGVVGQSAMAMLYEDDGCTCSNKNTPGKCYEPVCPAGYLSFFSCVCYFRQVWAGARKEVFLTSVTESVSQQSVELCLK